MSDEILNMHKTVRLIPAKNKMTAGNTENIDIGEY